jgi:hypothetical protein
MEINTMKPITTITLSVLIGAFAGGSLVAYRLDDVYQRYLFSAQANAAILRLTQQVDSANAYDEGQFVGVLQQWDSGICTALKIVNDYRKNGEPLNGDRLFVEKAAERMRVILSRESPESFPAYDQLAKCEPDAPPFKLAGL